MSVAVLDHTPAGQEPAQRTLSAGEAIGRFTLLERLGSGGMGEVWAAYDPP